MKHNLLSVAIFLSVCCIGIPSCDKSSMPNGSTTGQGISNSDDFILKEKVTYFDESNAKYIIVKNENSFVLKNGASVTIYPVVGDIVLSAASTTAPYGFLGRVLSVNDIQDGKEYETEPVALDEVFEEFHLEINIDIAEQLDNLVDDEGNPVKVETLDNSFWSQFEPEEDNETKVDYIKEKHQTKSIPLSIPFFDGSMIFSTDLHARIHIEKGSIEEYSIELRSATSISGGLKISGEQHKNVSQTYHFPSAIWVGPIALRPAIVIGLGLSAEGEVKMNGPITIGLSSTTTRWDNNNPAQTIIDKSHPVNCKATYLDCNGRIIINGRIALQFGVFTQSVLAFGVDWEPMITIGLSGEMHMKDKRVMTKDLKATISGSFGSFGAYLYSKLLSKNLKDNVRVSIQTPSFTYEIPLFDKGESHNCWKQTGNWAVSGKFKDSELLLAVEEKGYALFKINEEEPIELIIPSTTKSGELNGSFAISENPFEYYVLPYNRVGNYKFYGAPLGKYIAKLTESIPNNDIKVYSFEYDSYGRLTKVRYGNPIGYSDTIIYAYEGNSIILTYSDHDGVNWKSESLSLDSQGRLLSYANTSYSYTNGGASLYEESTDWWSRTSLSYDDGDLVSMIYTVKAGANSESTYPYSFAYNKDIIDDYSIDFAHTIFSPLSKTGLLPHFIPIPGIRNNHLQTAISGNPNFSISYSFDEDEKISSARWTEGECNITMSFMYEE